MPLDRLPPAPAPTVPSPKRAPRASSEDAQTFALPDSQDKAANNASRPDTAERKAAKTRETSEAKERDGSVDAQTQAGAAEQKTASDTASSLNDIFAQALQGDGTQSAEQSTQAPSDANAEATPEAAASKDATAKADAGGKPGADAPAPQAGQAKTGDQASAAPAAPSASAADLDDAAPEETVAVKPVSADKARPSPTSGDAAANASKDTPAQTQSAQGQQAASEPQTTVEAEDAQTRAKADAGPQSDPEAGSEPSGSARSAQADAAQARSPSGAENTPSNTDKTAKAQSDNAKSQAPVAQSASSETQADDAAESQARPQHSAQAQGQTQSANVVADQARQAASDQAAFKEGVEQTRRAESDRAPGAQNKSRHTDKSEAGAKTPPPQGAADPAAGKPAGPDAATQAARPGQQPVAAANAPTDPLAWLLQESLMAGDAPVEAPTDTADAELDMSTVRAEPRLEAARPSQHPQAHAASRFAPTTTHTLAAQIARKFNDGGRVFDIRLDPPELGRVEVRLELGPDNKVSAVLSAERADTLSELQRSARDLEKALTDAGLELGEDGLSFSLSEDNGAFNGFHDEAGGSADGFSARNTFTLEVETDAPGAPIADALYGFAVSQRAGVNLIA